MSMNEVKLPSPAKTARRIPRTPSTAHHSRLSSRPHGNAIEAFVTVGGEGADESTSAERLERLERRPVKGDEKPDVGSRVTATYRELSLSRNIT